MAVKANRYPTLVKFKIFLKILKICHLRHFFIKQNMSVRNEIPEYKIRLTNSAITKLLGLTLTEIFY